MHNLLQDVRYALRLMWKSPGFTAVAVITLAMGIGSTTAIFTVVNASLLRPLPYHEPERLVLLWGNTVREGVVERRGASYPDFRDWREQNGSFAAVAAWTGNGFTLTEGEAEQVSGELASASYFDVLGMAPVLGRTFLPEEDAVPNTRTSVVISHGFWTRRYGGDPGVIGRSIRLDGDSYKIVGVMPQGFRGLSDAAEIWAPMMVMSAATAQARGSRWFPAVARLKPGVSLAQAQAEMNAISARLEQAYPATNDQRGAEVIGLKDEVFSATRKPMLVLLGAVGLVLLIACGNVSSLLLARSEARQREFAVRRALGATRARIITQLLAESLCLAMLGAIVGLLIATWGVDALLALSPVALPSFVSLGADATVLMFTLLAAMITAAIMGILPALQLAPEGIGEDLKAAAGRAGSVTVARHRLRSSLVITEIALALALVVGAGLLIRSFQRLVALDPGFRSEGLLTLGITLPSEQADANMIVKARALVERLETLPSVQSVSLSSDLPLDGNASAVFYTPQGTTLVAEQKRPRAYVHRVSPEFFATLQIPLKKGRTFHDHEMRANAPAILVSEDVVRRYWPDADPIGRQLKLGGPDSSNPWLEVIGVVGDVKYRGLPRNPTPDPDIYLPLSERSLAYALAIRSSGDPAALAAAVRSEIRQADQAIPLFNVATMRELVDNQLATTRFAQSLMSAFALLALVLAVVGVYALMSYTVARRTHEIGIRMALGALPRDIFRRVLGQAARLAFAGVAFGIAFALAFGRVIASLLFEVSPASPTVLSLVSSLMVVCAVMASFVPAWRATKVDPTVALRYE